MSEFDKFEFRAKMRKAWRNKPPGICYRAEPMPDAPCLRLLGCGMANMSLESFIKGLERDKETGKGHGFTFPVRSDKSEEDTYILEGWEVYTGLDSCYEALVILYYSAMYPHQVIKKYMGEKLAEEYRCKQLATLN